eukprot:TRINITY_DN13121_c0_g1_i1.p1 TRINITY_DN13121_c0_g1~~TRINITY_DN13121_c0_g1_i1.p1  ORF type:complete len:427 (+),score=126.41 TRINITY_DN13121_c0_g1_i1:81-1361(+)
MKYYIFVLFALFIISSHCDDVSIILKNTNNYKSESISEYQVADLISHISGISPIHRLSQRDNFPERNIFNTPKANLLITFEGLTNNNQFDGQEIKITGQSSSEVDSLSAITTLLSGEPMDVHGVYGHSWYQFGDKHSKVLKYAEYGVDSNSAKVSDYISQTYEGKSLTIGMSADKQFAHALSAHEELSKNGSNNGCFYYNGDSFRNLFNREQMIFSRREVMSFLNNNYYVQNLYLVNINNEYFDLKKDMPFIVELFLLNNFAQYLETNYPEQVADNIVDFYSIGISSLNVIAQNYGKSSNNFKVASKLINDAIEKLQQELQAIYDQSIPTEFIFLGNFEQHTYSSPLLITSLALENNYLDKRESLNVFNKTLSVDHINAVNAGFWTTLFLSLVIIGISMATCMMNSGQGSIIYLVANQPKAIQDPR